MKTGTVPLLALSICVVSCGPPPEPKSAALPTAMPLSERVALPEVPAPPTNPMTPEKAGLGKQLFFDKRLSGTGMMSCESCHLPEMGWTDGQVVSTKSDGKPNVRHSPTLLNAAYYKQWYWDGRAATLEGQVLAAWRGQMGADPDQIAMTLNGIEGYKNDGHVATLEEAVDLLLAGGIKNANIDPKLKKRTITPEEKTQLMAFLKSLSPAMKPFERPTLP